MHVLGHSFVLLNLALDLRGNSLQVGGQRATVRVFVLLKGPVPCLLRIVLLPGLLGLSRSGR